MVKDLLRCGTRHLLACLIAALCTLGVATAVYADGQLDTTYSSNGLYDFDMDSGEDRAHSVAIQPNGKIVVVGRSNNGTLNNIAVARVNQNGGLDGSFGSGGRVSVNFFWGHDEGWDVAIQRDGKIVVVGTARIDMLDEVAVVRLNSNGTLDTSFGPTSLGYTTFNIGGGDSAAHGVALQPDGRIVVVGSTSYLSSMAVARLNTDGTLDNSFDGDGTATYDGVWGLDEAWDVAIQLDGKIVVVGMSTVDMLQELALVRFNSNGSLDTSFGPTAMGYSTTAIGNEAVARGVALGRQGKIIVAGSTDLNSAVVVARYTPSGILDTSFDGDGWTTWDGVWGFDKGWDVAMQMDGKIVAAGWATLDMLQEFLVVRLSANGSMDTTFNTWGYTSVNFAGNDSYSHGLALQPHDGKIVVAGWGEMGASNIDAFATARFIGMDDLLFADGFELGNTSRWTDTVP